MAHSAPNSTPLSPAKRVLKGLAIASLSATLVLPPLLTPRPVTSISDSTTAQLDFGRLIFNGVRALQFSNLSESQEVQMGADINRQMLQSGQFTLSRNREAIALVNRLGRRLVPHSDRPNLPYTFQVVQDNSINAFATTGGYVYITTGALRAADNQTQIAGVLAHEMAHITERHVVERMQRGTLAQAGAQAVGADNNLAAMAVELGVQRPHSREAEYEADKEGVMMMVRAGFDPRQMSAFMQKLLGSGSPPQILSTHPNTENRIERINAMIERDNLVARARRNRRRLQARG